MNPTVLANYGIGLEDVRTALGQVNADSAKGSFDNGVVRWTISGRGPIIRLPNSTARLSSRTITELRFGSRISRTCRTSVANIYTDGLENGQHSILLQISRVPGANIVATVDRINAALPLLKASIPPSVDISIGNDRTTTIRASVKEIQRTMLITIFLVILVIFVFLRNVWATVIPAVAVPVSLIGTFGVMYLLGYSLDNLSLMALTISTGFVVDDAIVVIENITRYHEAGLSPLQAAMKGSREIGFTVLTMSISLIAVFIPILMMSGIVGRLFREFAVTLSVAIMVSLMVSLTATPMMCARFLKPTSREPQQALRLERARFR